MVKERLVPTYPLSNHPAQCRQNNKYFYINTIFNTNTNTNKETWPRAADHEALSAPCLVSIVGAWDMLPVCGNWKGQQETTVWTTTTSAQTLRAPLLVPSIVNFLNEREKRDSLRDGKSHAWSIPTMVPTSDENWRKPHYLKLFKETFLFSWWLTQKNESSQKCLFSFVINFVALSSLEVKVGQVVSSILINKASV